MTEIEFVGYSAVHPSDFIYDVPNGFTGYLLLLFDSPSELLIDGRLMRTAANSAILYTPGSRIYYRAAGEEYRNDWIRFRSDHSFVKLFPLTNTPFPVTDPEYCHQLFKLLTWESAFFSSESEANITHLLRVLFSKLREGIQNESPGIHDHELIALHKMQCWTAFRVWKEPRRKHWNSCEAVCWESCSPPQSRKTPMKQTNERLCALAQKGDATALDSLIDNNKSFIGKVANDLFRSMNLAQAGLNLDTDDLKQAGNLGLWKAVPKFDAARGMKFLTYAAPAIRNAMMDMVRDAFAAFEQRMVTEDKDGVCYQRVSLDDVLPGEEQLRRIEAIADPYAMQPQSIMEEQESRRELYDGLKRLTQREQTYLLYRYGFTDGEEHPLIGTAIYFHLTKGRAKKTEEQAMDNLWLELPWWFL